MNNRISAKERGLIKGALRRVFSRSDLRRSIVDACRITHSDPKHPRVTRWGRCAECLNPTPAYKMQVDHVIPLVPLDRTLEDMTWDELINNLWCDPSNLSPLCIPCHKLKSSDENKQRRLNRAKLTQSLKPVTIKSGNKRKCKKEKKKNGR